MSTYKSHRSTPGRVFDHVYDPLFATSGPRDIWRNNARSLAVSAQVQIYPVYKTMFTDLPWRPRNYFVRLRNPLPFVNAMDKPSSTETRTGIAVTGSDRAKFFNMPIGGTKTINLHLDIKANCGCLPPGPASRECEPPFKTVGMQTVYREQSAQTKPWMPNAIIGEQETETPEIVYVAEILKEDAAGTMPGIYEAEMVARARKRREWENSLPTISSFDEWNHRRLVLAAFEWEDWIGREKKIEYCQRIRLGIVHQMMQDRKQARQSKSAISIATKMDHLEHMREKKLQQLRTNYRRRLKRIQLEHKGVKMKYQPLDIISEHIDPSSDLYGQQSRFGVHPKHRHFMAHKTNYQARLDALQDDKKPISCKPFIERAVDLSRPKPPLKEVERNLYNEKALRELYESLLFLRSLKSSERKTPQCLRNKQPDVFEAAILHSSESVLDPMLEEHDHQMAIYLQRMLKGRAIQNEICAGRNKCRELIAEFRTTHILPEIQEMNAQEDKPNQLTEDRKFARHQQIRLAAILSSNAQIRDLADQAKGTTMSFALDLLEKEMVRLKDQKKAHALCMLAEHERYRREVTEVSHRMRGDNRRRTHDEISRNVQLSKHNTIAAYLENVLVDCIDQTAERDALQNIRNVVRKIDREAANPTPRKVVTSILNRFILPDVFRRIARDNYLADVHQTIFGEDGVIPDLEKEQRQMQLNRFLETAVTPRPESMDSNDTSPLSSLDSLEDPAHHEAMRCIEKAITRSVQVSSGFNQSQTFGLLDDIISRVIPGEQSAREHQQQLQVTSITSDLKSALWECAESNKNLDESELK